jgi:hypothetical protein
MSEVPTEQPGYADPYLTYGCIALPKGGLAPLPLPRPIVPSELTSAPNYPGSLNDTVADPIAVTGLRAFGSVASDSASPLGTSSSDELHVFLEGTYSVSGTEWREFEWLRLRYFDVTPTWEAIVDFAEPLTGYPYEFPGLYWGVPHGTTRGQVLEDGYEVYVPVVIAGYKVLEAVWTWPASSVGDVWAYPNPATASSNTPLAVGEAPGGGGNMSAGPILVCHQGRVVVPQVIAIYHGNNATAYANDSFCYTDPVFVLTTGGQQNEMFFPEAPFGIGAMQAVNAGELFYVKHYGGGVLLSGDLDDAVATALPSVQATGGVVSLGAAHPLGYIYITNEGLFVWAVGR